MTTLATTTHHDEGRYDWDIDDTGVPCLHNCYGRHIDTMRISAASLFALAEQLRVVHGVTTAAEARAFDQALWDRAGDAGDNVVQFVGRAAR